jgi:hypothetical protein
MRVHWYRRSILSQLLLAHRFVSSALFAVRFMITILNSPKNAGNSCQQYFFVSNLKPALLSAQAYERLQHEANQAC